MENFFGNFVGLETKAWEAIYIILYCFSEISAGNKGNNTAILTERVVYAKRHWATSLTCITCKISLICSNSSF